MNKRRDDNAGCDTAGDVWRSSSAPVQRRRLPARLGRGGHDGQMAAVTSTSEARRADRLAGASTTVRSVSELQSPSMSLTGLRRMVCLVSLEWEQVVVAAQKPAALGRWWADALGWVVVNDSAEEFVIRCGRLCSAPGRCWRSGNPRS
jgi:hypothetical protein